MLHAAEPARFVCRPSLGIVKAKQEASESFPTKCEAVFDARRCPIFAAALEVFLITTNSLRQLKYAMHHPRV